MEREALLIRMEKGLELKVWSDKEGSRDDSRRFYRPNQEPPCLIHSICFKDEREPEQIVKEFAEMYPGSSQIRVQADGGEFAIVEYPSDFEPAIRVMYNKYFSEKK